MQFAQASRWPRPGQPSACPHTPCGRCSTLDVRQRGRPRADTHAVRTDRSSMVPPRPRTPHCTEPSHAPVAAPRIGCSCHALGTTPRTAAPASIGSTTRLAWAPSGKVHLRHVTTGTLHSPPGSPDVASAGPRWLSSGVKQTQVLAKGSLRQVLTNQLHRPRLFQPFGLDIVH